jgi:sec-independent protein translocase protein TatB
MFDIGFSELVLIALLALIVLGPKRLPEAARAAGHWVGRLRRFITDVKQDFDRELHGAELSELRQLKQELDDTRRIVGESSSELVQQLTGPVAPPEHAAPRTGETSSAIAPAAAGKRRARRRHVAKKKHGRTRTSRRR